MTAELSVIDIPTLYCEPVRPKARPDRAQGWRWGKKQYSRKPDRLPIRTYSDDAAGALAQTMVLRYVLGGETRSEIAQSLNYSERQVQATLNGESWASYTAPLFSVFMRLGISTTRGWGVSNNKRMREIVQAQRRVMRAMLARPTDPQVQFEMHLLSSVRWPGERP